MARDGYILKKITEEIILKLNLEIKCEYLYVSRQSLRICNIKQLDEGNLKWILKKPKNSSLNIDLVLKRLSLKMTNDIKLILKDYHINKKTSSKEKLSLLLKDERMQKVILSHAKREKKIAIEYFKELGLGDIANRYALVDIGWQGRIPVIIKKLLKLKKLSVFYFGNLNSNKTFDIDIKSWLFTNSARVKWFDFFDNTVALDLIEIMTSADHQTLLHYGELKNRIPIYNKDSKLLEWGILKYHQAIINYVKNINKADFDYFDNVVNRDLVYDKIKNITLKPSKAEAKVFGDFPYCAEQTDMFRDKFGPKITLKEYFKEPKLITKILWKKGTYKQSNIFIKLILLLNREANY